MTLSDERVELARHFELLYHLLARVELELHSFKVFNVYKLSSNVVGNHALNASKSRF